MTARRTLLMACCLSAIPAYGSAEADDVRPNILWITSEDNGPQLGCYGDEYAVTPNLDRLAETSHTVSPLLVERPGVCPGADVHHLRACTLRAPVHNTCEARSACPRAS